MPTRGYYGPDREWHTSCPYTFYWLKRSKTATSHCKGGWKTSSSCVPRNMRKQVYLTQLFAKVHQPHRQISILFLFPSTDYSFHRQPRVPVRHHIKLKDEDLWAMWRVWTCRAVRRPLYTPICNGGVDITTVNTSTEEREKRHGSPCQEGTVRSFCHSSERNSLIKTRSCSLEETPSYTCLPGVLVRPSRCFLLCYPTWNIGINHQNWGGKAPLGSFHNLLLALQV